jgi:DNA-binding response OmpR family regulator
VLVVDDDPKIVELVKAYLERAGHEVVTAGDGKDALRMVEEHKPALVVIDVMLPSVDGLLVSRQLRVDRGQIPILMMSARGSIDDRIRGLVEGADDYLPKPFSPAELVARVDALLRRSGLQRPANSLPYADLDIDLDRREVRKAGRLIALTAAEFRILAALVQARGRVLTREHIVEMLHGYGGAVTERAIDVHVRRLRKKLGDDSALPRYVVTVRGAGYRSVASG